MFTSFWKWRAITKETFIWSIQYRWIGERRERETRRWDLGWVKKAEKGRLSSSVVCWYIFTISGRIPKLPWKFYWFFPLDSRDSHTFFLSPFALSLSLTVPFPFFLAFQKHKHYCVVTKMFNLSFFLTLVVPFFHPTYSRKWSVVWVEQRFAPKYKSVS